MLLLASTASKLQLVSSAAVALDVQASWVDISGTTITPGTTNTVIVTATTTDIVPSPAASTSRNIKHLSIRARGGANTVIIKHTDGTTAPEMIKVPLTQDETLLFNDGTGFQVLDASGGVQLSFAPTGGRYIKATVYTTGAANHTTDAKCSLIKVRLIGGGGGGGGASSAAVSAACAAGGGGGSYAEKDFIVSPSTAYAYSVGAAGTAGSNAGGTGGAGGNTTFTGPGAVVVTAPGGAGGAGQVAGTTANIVSQGGAGGAVSTNGDLNGGGDPGEMGQRISGTVGWSGGGGSTRTGGGGVSRTTAGVGNAGVGEGSGGGGALVLNASAAALGGVGQSGVVAIEEYT